MNVTSLLDPKNDVVNTKFSDKSELIEKRKINSHSLLIENDPRYNFNDNDTLSRASDDLNKTQVSNRNLKDLGQVKDIYFDIHEKLWLYGEVTEIRSGEQEFDALLNDEEENEFVMTFALDDVPESEKHNIILGAQVIYRLEMRSADGGAITNMESILITKPYYLTVGATPRIGGNSDEMQSILDVFKLMD
ncbi:MAG: hypothetical protein NUW37_02540 [Planctomycetes bacterium]|nr:hypothetical protein [Planctomycetota bacterium]